MNPAGAQPGGLDAVPAPQYHADTDALRFWVTLSNGAVVGATLSRQVLHYGLQGRLDGSDAVAVYQAHREQADAAVRRRVAAGSREPVMLREHDLLLPAST